MSSEKRLLLLACSARKRVDAGLLPALERYDGVLYRVLRRWLRHAPAEQRHATDILILSAEFGLIETHLPIPYYDRKMSRARARELAPQTVAALHARIQSVDYQEILLAMGKLYQETLEPIARWATRPSAVRCVVGGIGQQAAQLREWLSAVCMSTPNGD